MYWVAAASRDRSYSNSRERDCHKRSRQPGHYCRPNASDMVDAIGFVRKGNPYQDDARTIDIVNEDQLPKIFIRRNYNSFIAGSHQKDFYILYSWRDKRRIETVVTEVADHRYHLDADVSVGKKLHFVVRSSSCRTTETA
jgi:hypothetical protein